MKKLLSIIVIIAISLAATAQEKRQKMQDKGGFQEGRHRPGKPHNRQMMKELNFSEAQKSTLRANRESFRAKMQQLEKEENITVKEYRSRKAALLKENRAAMQSVLTPEQQIKMAEMKMKREQQHKERDNLRFEKMKSNLSLTNEQAAQIKNQQEALRMKQKAIRENESLSMEQKKQQMKALQESARQERMKVLTAEQQEKMKARKKKLS